MSYFNQRRGVDWLNHPLAWGVSICFFILISLLIQKKGFKLVPILIALPIVIGWVLLVFKNPKLGLYTALFITFIMNGLTKYVYIPMLGLSVDALFLLSLLAVFLKKFKKTNWSLLQNDLMLLTLAWVVFTILEVLNPEAVSRTAWFYGIRSLSLNMLFIVTLGLLLFQHKDLNFFIKCTFVMAAIAAFWGMRQLYVGLNGAELRWLAAGAAKQHILFGKLRVFSFLSDAGQFGASQAHFALMAGIMAINTKESIKNRLFFAFICFVCLWGMFISGTRGALAVPAFGGIIYLLLIRNFKLLFLGLAVMLCSFVILKYTFLFHNVSQVRRMRTALDPNDASFQVRLMNQRKLAQHLKSRPFGGGVGSTGFWGHKFSPNTFLGSMPTDSYYVKIWAETGAIGLFVYFFIMAYIFTKCGYYIWHTRDPILKHRLLALYAGVIGVFVASYGNEVFNAAPTFALMYISITLIYISPKWDSPKEKNNQIPIRVSK